MSFAAGTRLGPYEILAAVGAGGMGEVYRAKDTRLNRTVAIKVLPPHLSSNPDLRQRFEREARAVSRLSHPNICTLHDIGRQDGIDYLVMEFLEGETLADRLRDSRCNFQSPKQIERIYKERNRFGIRRPKWIGSSLRTFQRNQFELIEAT